VSMRTRRGFKAMLAWDAEAGKVNFEFAPSKFPPRKTAGKPAGKPTAAAKKAAARATPASAAAKKVPVKKAAAKKTATKSAVVKVPRKTTAKPGSGFLPSEALAAVIGTEAIARPQVIKKMWDYIKANNLQDATNKRAINADAKLLAVFGKPQVTMFELTGIVGKHLTAQVPAAE
jgi:DNA topoisomerase-3